jgi:hypothetical protein
MRPFCRCRTRAPPVRVSFRMVHRSPFLTQSAALTRSLRSFRRGDDQVADAGPVAIVQISLRTWSRTGEAVILGALVEPADQLAGRGQHHGVQTSGAVGQPGVEKASRAVVGSPMWTRRRSR